MNPKVTPWNKRIDTYAIFVRALSPWHGDAGCHCATCLLQTMWRQPSAVADSVEQHWAAGSSQALPQGPGCNKGQHNQPPPIQNKKSWSLFNQNLSLSSASVFIWNGLVISMLTLPAGFALKGNTHSPPQTLKQMCKHSHTRSNPCRHAPLRLWHQVMMTSAPW